MRSLAALRKVYEGDIEGAQMYTSIARTQLGVLKSIMGDIQQLQRSITLADGTRITVASHFGQESVRIEVPTTEVPALEGESRVVEEELPAPLVCRRLHVKTEPEFSVRFMGSGRSWYLQALANGVPIPGKVSPLQVGTIGPQFQCTSVLYGTRGGYQQYTNYGTPGGVLNGVGGGGIGVSDSCYTLTQTALPAGQALAGLEGKITVYLDGGEELATGVLRLNSSGVPANAPLPWTGEAFIKLGDGTKLEFQLPVDVCPVGV